MAENKLWPKDEQLLTELINHPTSANEKAFFSKLKQKMESELAPCQEVLFSMQDNPDQLYVLRDGYDEFIIGSGKEDLKWDVVHTMSLSDALQTNLKESGLINQDMTLLEWLRQRDYANALFHNQAYS